MLTQWLWNTTVPLTYISSPISGVPGLPPVLLPQLGRARHLQEEADPRQGPPPTVRDEGELSFLSLAWQQRLIHDLLCIHI